MKNVRFVLETSFIIIFLRCSILSSIVNVRTYLYFVFKNDLISDTSDFILKEFFLELRIIEKENSFHQKEKINDWKDLEIVELQNEVSRLSAENTKLITETEHLRRENKILTSSREKLRINISVERRKNVLLKEQISAEKKRHVKTVTQKNKDIFSLRKSSLSALRSTLSLLR